jgi:hypothetical protein
VSAPTLVTFWTDQQVVVVAIESNFVTLTIVATCGIRTNLDSFHTPHMIVTMLATDKCVSYLMPNCIFDFIPRRFNKPLAYLDVLTIVEAATERIFRVTESKRPALLY